MTQTAAAILLTAILTAFLPAEAGHELPYYPSYYPQEIRIEPVDAAEAATRLQHGSLHAYIGGDPFVTGTIPVHVSSVESLGSYWVVTFNPALGVLRDRERRCAVASRLLTALAGERETYIFHPYPVTPYHMDYLQHFDAAESAQQEPRHRAANADPVAGRTLSVRAEGTIGEKLAQAGWRLAEDTWDATAEEIDVGALGSAPASGFNGWLGPPWAKEGWFHAYRLLADHIADRAAKLRVDALYQRLVRGDHASLEEKLNLERTLVSQLTQGCERVVVGYTVKREYFNAEFSAGVENIAHDSHTGFNAPIFLRTVKLKDFPWNGWLRLGIPAKPWAAWNPMGGFTDAAGRLLWFSVGDPAFLPSPHTSGWIPNRISPTIAVEGSRLGGVGIPPDALLAEPATGRLRGVGAGRTATAKVTYRALTSAFQDGTPMAVADLLYPYSVASRWSVQKPSEGAEYDPSIATSTAWLRERLAGLKVLRVEQEAKHFGELTVRHTVPVIEVYLHDTWGDPQQVAALAPPWSSVPWHLIVLMEESVKRGFAAFSREEARRLGVAWLDLVKDQRLRDRFVALVDDFAVQGYVPEPLRRFVTEQEARQRWANLKTFYLTRGHFLVTNGPYMLAKWSENAVVLQVFRDLTYPLGIGAYDMYVFPPKAYISKLALRRNRLEIAAEVEKVEKFQRTYQTMREPLTAQTLVGVSRVRSVCRYVVLTSAGEVVKAGTAQQGADGNFGVELGEISQPGRYTILITISLNENAVKPDVRMVPYAVAR
ncbi:MAG: hypothetical protein HYZ81_21430 [Nitrospinae bacterium]|nr:hypothetical protein [Nitrospinota bacterium]